MEGTKIGAATGKGNWEGFNNSTLWMLLHQDITTYIRMFM